MTTLTPAVIERDLAAVSFNGGEPGAEEFRYLRRDVLLESPHNPRRHFDPKKLEELATSIRATGIHTPLLARPHRDGDLTWYEIGAGHRRYRAAALADVHVLPVRIREMDDASFLELLTIENLQRDDLNALEEAQGFVALMTDAGYDVPKIAERVGRSVKYVYDRIKLLQLIPEAKELLLDGTITPGHGILLARLGKEDQKRALVPDDTSRGGGLLERESIDDSYFAGREPQLDLEDPKKARSVRELQQWIDRNVRFVPARVDQGDLAFDLPKTAELLDSAAKQKLKVVKITREYRVPDEARDEKERTYGQDSWKRADGEPELFSRFGPIDNAKPSKTCDHSVVGLVVAGPGRGDAFLVCVNKDRCSVHWAEEMGARAKRAKEREQPAGKDGTADGQAQKAKAIDPDILPDELRGQWVQEQLATRLPAIVKAVEGVVAEIRISDEICWNIVGADFWLESWNKVGKRGYQRASRTTYGEELEPLVAARLPGRFEPKTMRGTDGPGTRSELAWLIWLARDSKGLDESIDKAIAARWAEQRKAAKLAKKAEPKKGAAKKRAGNAPKKKAKGKKAAARA